jgi:hypothetical protein
MIKPFIVAAIILSIAIPAIAEDLYCAGTSYFYKDGFGNGMPLKSEASRLVSINKKTKEMTIETALGEKTTVTYLDDNKIISTVIPMKQDIHGRLVDLENININQYTGKMTGTYFLADKQMYSSFEGVCKIAKKAF